MSVSARAKIPVKRRTLRAHRCSLRVCCVLPTPCRCCCVGRPLELDRHPTTATWRTDQYGLPAWTHTFLDRPNCSNYRSSLHPFECTNRVVRRCFNGCTAVDLFKLHSASDLERNIVHEMIPCGTHTLQRRRCEHRHRNNHRALHQSLPDYCRD
jgi:hypothetical protein